MSGQFVGCTKSRVLLTKAKFTFSLSFSPFRWFQFSCALIYCSSHLAFRSYVLWPSFLFLLRLIAPCKGIQDSVRFWIPRRRLRIPVVVSRTWILDSKCDLVRFRVLELYSGFRSPEFRIPQAKLPGSRIAQAKIVLIPETRFTVYKRWGWGRP